MSTAIEWTGETWNPTRPIPGYPGYYVTADGTMQGPRGRMHPMVAASGHRYVLVSRPEVPRKLFVHTAVLLAWVGPRPVGMQCRHLDGDPEHNAVENLRWGTAQDNTDDKRRHGRQPRGERTGAARLTEADVRAIRQRLPTSTTRALAAEYGVSHTAIRKAANGEKWRHVA
jgi:hypothetical protein